MKDATGAWRSLATKAANKTDARRLAEDIERRAERQRHGLEPLPCDTTMTLAELCAWWLRERCPAPSIEGERRRLDLHVTRTPLGDIPLSQVTPAALEGRRGPHASRHPRRALPRPRHDEGRARGRPPARAAARAVPPD